MHDWIASGPGFKNCKKYLIKSAQHYTQQKTNVDNFQEISFYTQIKAEEWGEREVKG